MFLVFFTSSISFGQLTKIRGKIIDAETKEPLPFVNLAFKGTTIGTISDFNGNYFLQCRESVDSLIVSYVGYKTKTIKVRSFQFQTNDISLKPANIQLISSSMMMLVMAFETQKNVGRQLENLRKPWWFVKLVNFLTWIYYLIIVRHCQQLSKTFLFDFSKTFNIYSIFTLIGKR